MGNDRVVSLVDRLVFGRPPWSRMMHRDLSFLPTLASGRRTSWAIRPLSAWGYCKTHANNMVREHKMRGKRRTQSHAVLAEANTPVLSSCSSLPAHAN
jgi:hypothetical protein